MNDWMIAGLVIVSAVALALALPFGSLVRIGIVAVGVVLGIGASQVSLSVQGVTPDANVGANEEAAEPLIGETMPHQVVVTYRVTATVRVNGELRTGISLQRSTISRNDFFGSQRLNTTTNFHGEAVAVPIVDETYLLFAMQAVPGNRSYEGVMTSPCRDIFAYSGSERPTADSVLANAANFTGPCDLSPDRMPLMLAVTNSSEPVGFQVVTPSTLADVFGLPVEVVSLSFSRTDEPLQFDLAEIFPWLKAALARTVNMPIELEPNPHLSAFYISYISTGSEE